MRRATLWAAAFLISMVLGLGRTNPTKRNVGFADLALTDPIGGGPMAGMVTYPTLADPQSHRIGPYYLEVAENAPPAAGTFPIIVFSPGRTGAPENYNDFFIALTQSGFIVAGLAIRVIIVKIAVAPMVMPSLCGERARW